LIKVHKEIIEKKNRRFASQGAHQCMFGQPQGNKNRLMITPRPKLAKIVAIYPDSHVVAMGTNQSYPKLSLAGSRTPEAPLECLTSDLTGGLAHAGHILHRHRAALSRNNGKVRV